MVKNEVQTMFEDDTCEVWCECGHRPYRWYDCDKVTTSLVLRINQVIANLEAEHVSVPRRSSVEDYLLDYPSLLSPIVQAAKKAREIFSSSADLSLEMFTSHEDGDSFLMLCVRQNPYQPDILEKIDLVNDDLFPALENTSGHFVVLTDFRLHNEHGIPYIGSDGVYRCKCGRGYRVEFNVFSYDIDEKDENFEDRPEIG